MKIDARHLGEEFLQKNFPGMVERCRTYGFDLLHEPVEVSPSAHYQMGGIKIDVDCHSNLEGLFAAGEDAGGVHGANRLGGNGVADSIVYGARAGDSMVRYLEGARPGEPSEAQVHDLAEIWSRSLRLDRGENAFALREQLDTLMWEKVGIVRNQQGLKAALDELRCLREQTHRVKASGDPAFNLEWNAAINLANLNLVAEMVARSALFRRESRGAHFRSDLPASDPQWLKKILITSDGKDGMKLSVEPIAFTHVTPPELSNAKVGGADRL